MKLLSITMFTLLSSPTFAIELHSCTDDAGKIHYTNLPKNSLDLNCHSKDHYTVMLEQDYDNLTRNYQQYETDEMKEVDENSTDTLKDKVSNIFDPDKALEEIMDTTEDRDDVFTRAIRGRTQSIKNVLEQENNVTP